MRCVAVAWVTLALVACSDFTEGEGGPVPSSGTSTGSAEDGSSSSSGPGDSTSLDSDSMSGGDSTGAQETTGIDPSSTGGGSGEETGEAESTGGETNLYDGSYAGSLMISMSSSGFPSVNCSGPVNFVVAEGAATSVQGGGSCDVEIPGLGNVMGNIAVTGDVTGVGMGGGDATLSTVWDTTTTKWEGSFGQDSFTGTFSGSYNAGLAVVDYMGVWTSDR